MLVLAITVYFQLKDKNRLQEIRAARNKKTMEANEARAQLFKLAMESYDLKKKRVEIKEQYAQYCKKTDFSADNSGNFTEPFNFSEYD